MDPSIRIPRRRLMALLCQIAMVRCVMVGAGRSSVHQLWQLKQRRSRKLSL
ncbi:hypothetical protein LINPERHAP2_LOCUS3813 [Linum perenne]